MHEHVGKESHSKGDLHASDLKEAFKCMSKHSVCLNQSMCAFKVKSREFMGFW